MLDSFFAAITGDCAQEISEDQTWLDAHVANLTDEERAWLEDQLAKGAGIYRVYPRHAKPGESHWSDGTVTYDPTSNVRYGCFPGPDRVPVEINKHTTIYMTPEAAEMWTRRNSFFGALDGLLDWIVGGRR